MTLEVLSIPSLDLNQNACDKVENGAGGDSVHNSTSPKLSRYSPNSGAGPSPASNVLAEEDVAAATHSDQSNSEDSSLSDSDRTLVGDAPDECLAQLSSTSNSPAGSEQHLSSPEEPPNVSRYIYIYIKIEKKN